MFKKVNKRVYEMECYKGFFIVEMIDIPETICNSSTGETSTLKCDVYYRSSENYGITTFLIGTYVTTSEEEELEVTYDMIVNTDFFDGSIELYEKEMALLEEQEF